MFLDTADCTAVKGTMLASGNRGGELVVVALAVGAGAAAGEGGGGGGVTVGATPAAASTSEAVILPNGPVPATDPISTLCCFASFLACGVATVFLGPSDAAAAGAGDEVAGGGDGTTAEEEGFEAALFLASSISASVSASNPIAAPTGAVSPSPTTIAAR